MTDVDSSHTAKNKEKQTSSWNCKSNDEGMQDIRFLNIVRINLLGTKELFLPMRHGKQEVIIRADIARLYLI